MIALVTLHNSNFVESTPSYVVQEYWYALAGMCQNDPNFISAYVLDTCFQQTSTQYVYYSYVNTSSTAFTVTMKTYSDSACATTATSTSTGSYSSVCSTVGDSTTSSYVLHNSIPDFSDYSGSSNTFYSTSACSTPTNLVWTGNTMCAPSGTTSNMQSCTPDGELRRV